MEIVFRENPTGCLTEQAVDVLYQEETTELIVPDSCPDVLSIADCCAVCCLRDKEILPGSFSVSGAFQATVLYTSEEDQELRQLDAYLPFTVKLASEAISADSIGIAEARLRSVDARILNSRKILVRVSYAVRLTAYGHSSISTYDTDCGEPLQLLRKTEKGLFPVAAVEKKMSFSESVELPAAGAEIQGILKAMPEISLPERRAAENRAILKGAVQLHTLYLLENGQLNSFDVQLPVSQYLEFEEDLSDAELRVTASLTDFQVEQEESGGYLVTVGLLLQVVALRQLELPVIADGYCVGRDLQTEFEAYQILEPLDNPVQIRTAEEKLQGKVRKLLDCTALVDFPVCRRSEDELTITAPVTMHALYYDEEGAICGETVKCEESCAFALCAGADCFADAEASGACYASMAGDEASLCCGISLSGRCFAKRTVQGMKSAQAGEKREVGAERPSLIVRRIGDGDCLFQIAKRCDTTVRAIREANALSGEQVEADQLLLIPMA